MIRTDTADQSPHDVTSAGFDAQLRECLAVLLTDGMVVRAGASRSVSQNQATREILNYSLRLPDGRDRWSATRPVSLIGAVGRFVWMMSGSDRLADIEFYEPKVSGFTDDGLSVPGSSYGARLLRPRVGINQLEAAIDLLESEAGTRRAAAAIYQPEDAGRDSRDIPCAFGLLWHLRGSTLYATTLMRSNNAWTLLPYNVFEFTLLMELIAARLNVDVGEYYHYAASLHIYDANRGDLEAALETPAQVVEPPLPPVPKGPFGGSLRDLLMFERQVRERAAGLDSATLADRMADAEKLGAFWGDLAKVLVAGAVRHEAATHLVDQTLESFDPPATEMIERDLARIPVVAGDLSQESSRFYIERARDHLRSKPKRRT